MQEIEPAASNSTALRPASVTGARNGRWPADRLETRRIAGSYGAAGGAWNREMLALSPHRERHVPATYGTSMRSALLVLAVVGLTVYGQLAIKARVALHTAQAGVRGKLHYLALMFTDIWVLS